jgi:hypothetical protein
MDETMIEPMLTLVENQIYSMNPILVRARAPRPRARKSIP